MRVVSYSSHNTTLIELMVQTSEEEWVVLLSMVVIQVGQMSLIGSPLFLDNRLLFKASISFQVF